MRRTRGVVGLRLGLALSIVMCMVPCMAGPALAGERFPVWPSEVSQLAAPLHDKEAGESERIAVLNELQRYATEVIVEEVVTALEDESPQVRRWALEMCVSRELMACAPAAERMWKESVQESVRSTALAVLALDPSGDRAQLIFDALREPSDPMRAHAATLLGQAPLQGKTRDRARRELAAQLGDGSARVRLTAAQSLGRLGPGKGALPLTRLLDDNDMEVRQAAARALGQMREAGAAPAVRRALQRAPTPQVAGALVEALAQIPGTEIDTLLLDLLDNPPNGVRSSAVLDAIGRRPEPDAELLRGLVLRLRHDELTDDILRAMMLQGDRAVPALAEASARGLEPHLQLEVERLLAARRDPSPIAEPGLARVVAPEELPGPLPQPEDRSGWDRRLQTGDLEAALELGRLAPPWVQAAVRGRLKRRGSPESLDAWLVVLSQLSAISDPAMISYVEHFARNIESSTRTRCLATLALGSGSPKLRAVEAALADLLADRNPQIRMCATLAAGRFPKSGLPLDGMLLDSSPSVRVAAALALGSQDRKPARLGLVEVRDQTLAVREAAAYGLREPLTPRPPEIVLATEPWVAVDTAEGTSLHLPTVGPGPERLLILPMAAERRDPDE